MINHNLEISMLYYLDENPWKSTKIRNLWKGDLKNAHCASGQTFSYVCKTVHLSMYAMLILFSYEYFINVNSSSKKILTNCVLSKRRKQQQQHFFEVDKLCLSQEAS